MKHKSTIVMILITILISIAFVFYLFNNIVPNIIGSFGSSNDNQKTQISFAREGEYVIYREEKEYDHTEHAYILDSINDNDGLIILTNNQNYLNIPTLQKDPILLDKLSDVPTYINSFSEEK